LQIYCADPTEGRISDRIWAPTLFRWGLPKFVEI
jgi:hypothetical protein